MIDGHDDSVGLALREVAGVRTGLGRPEFEAFLSVHYPLLMRFLRRRAGDAPDLEDLAQESLARLLRYQHAQPPHAWRPLLFRIASRVLVDRRRRDTAQSTALHLSLEDTPAAALPGGELPEQRLADRERLERVLAAVAALPPKCRQVFLLSRFHHLSNQDIAARCRISVRMVEKQISKALAVCRSTLDDEA
jgi:RNA polymerase sigma-70 factor (ECF subfamily)